MWTGASVRGHMPAAGRDDERAASLTRGEAAVADDGGRHRVCTDGHTVESEASLSFDEIRGPSNAKLGDGQRHRSDRSRERCDDAYGDAPPAVEDRRELQVADRARGRGETDRGGRDADRVPEGARQIAPRPVSSASVARAQHVAAGLGGETNVECAVDQ